MKRSKNDHIRSTISRYFKRRQFTESEMPSRKDTRREQSMQDLSVRRQTRSRSSVENILALTSITGDAIAFDDQFTRLKTFIETASSPYKAQLDNLMFPMFANVYLEMLCNGQKAPAHKFHDRHCEGFGHPDQHIFLKLLKKLETKSEVLTNKTVLDFRENRTQFKADQDTIDYLMRFLKLEDNMMILQIYNQYIQTQGTLADSGHELNSLPEVIEEEGDVNGNCKPAAALDDHQHSAQNGRESPEQEGSLDQRLVTAIKAVRDLSPSLPSICFFTFMNTYQGLCSIMLSPDKKRVSGSFEDGSLSVWSVEPESFSPAPVDCDPSHVTLSADYLRCTEEEMKNKMNSRVGVSCERATMLGHRGAAYKTRFTQDSKSHLLSCSEDSTVRLWNMSTHTNSVIYKGHTGPVWDVSLSSTDSWFASCSQDTTAKLWTFDRTFPLRSYIGHAMDIDCLEFHPNNNYLATGSADKTVRFWTVTDARTVRLLQGHRGSILALAFSPNGKLVAGAGEDRRVRVWDLGSGQLMKELRGHSDTVYSLAFDEQSRMLASGGGDCCIRLWDVSRGTEAHQLEGHSSPELLGAFPTKSAVISYLSFSHQNLLFAAGASS